ncbi:hypothetical protein ACWD26_25365 [Streptomyces sp. NPDC002787]
MLLIDALLREYDRARAYTDDVGHPLPLDPDSEHLRRIDGYFVVEFCSRKP